MLRMMEDDTMNCLRTLPDNLEPPPPTDPGLPVRPRASRGLHTFAVVISALMLLFDGFMAMGIVSTVASMLQLRANPEALLKTMPTGPFYPPLPWLREYAFPLAGWVLIGQFGSLLLVLGIFGFLQRRRWCVHPLVLGFGIHFVNLIVLSVAFGPMMSSLSAVTHRVISPAENTAGWVVAALFLWALFGLFRGLPALILRASANARWEEEFR